MNMQRSKATESYLAILDKMYSLLGENTPADGVSYESVAKATDTPPWMMINIKVLLEQIGILESKVAYNPMVDGKRIMGRRATWTLVKSHEEARHLLVEWEKRGEPWEYEKRSDYVVKSPQKKAVVEEVPVTVAKTEKEETRAIAGPEPEKTFAALASLRKDEPRALVEAARQYANRQTSVEREYQSLITMGLSVDREMFLKAISLPKDDFLETISTLLPLITELENKNEHLLDQLNAARDKTRDYAELKGNYERLQKLWNQRVADKVRAS